MPYNDEYLLLSHYSPWWRVGLLQLFNRGYSILPRQRHSSRRLRTLRRQRNIQCRNKGAENSYSSIPLISILFRCMTWEKVEETQRQRVHCLLVTIRLATPVRSNKHAASCLISVYFWWLTTGMWPLPEWVHPQGLALTLVLLVRTLCRDTTS